MTDSLTLKEFLDRHPVLKQKFLDFYYQSGCDKEPKTRWVTVPLKQPIPTTFRDILAANPLPPVTDFQIRLRGKKDVP